LSLLTVTLALTCASSASAQPRFLWGEGRPRFHAIAGGDPRLAREQSLVGQNVPLWNGSFAFQGQTFDFTMVGTDPNLGSATTVIPVVIVPLEFQFTDGTALSATDPICGGTDDPITLAQNSPLFQPFSFMPGGTDVGTTQYIDAFQRANFWSVVSTSAPDYHVSLTATVMPTQTIKVSRLMGSTIKGPCARIGKVRLQLFDSTIRRLITSLGIPPTSLPLFVSYNTFLTEGGCCILGYHSVTTGSQTYAFAVYSDPGIFNVPIEDIHAMSHELGEWLADPLVDNRVPAWEEGQATSCQRNLEVGDPVTGIAFTATLNGTDYHPEDLVFLPWFSRESPSSSVNGWYTFLNSFAAPPPVCH
jgi:hypothetical protein